MTGNVIPIYYINLAARSDRRDFMESQFARLAIPAERVEAVLPAQIPADIVATSRRPDGTFRIGISDIACTLSHFAAWHRAIDSRAAACAVFEDDGVISRDLPQLIGHLGPSLPDGVDLLKLETFRDPVRLGRDTVTIGGMVAQRLIGTHYGCCGYIISTKLAEHVIATMPLASRAIDGHLFVRHGDLLATRRVYQLRPALAVQLMHQHLAGTSDLAQSDLAPMRKWSSGGRPWMTRWQRLRDNISLAWREYRAFGNEVFNARQPVLFADDEPDPSPVGFSK